MKDLKYKPDLEVPCYENGDMASWWDRDIVTGSNQVFTSKMRVVKFLNGRSSRNVLLERLDTGTNYSMFQSDFESVVVHSNIIKGVFEDTFHIEKRGGSYGLVPHLGRTIEE